MTKFIHWILDDHGIDDSMTVLEELEKIDDDCDKHGIQFVKIDDDRTSRGYGIDSVPAIVYFEKQIPNIYSGDLLNEEEILHWLVSQLEKDEIEDVTDEMLDRMVKEGSTLAVLFCKCELYSIQLLVWGSWPVMFRFIHFPDDNNDDKSQKVLEELENIDDECDALGITFVKIDNIDEAKEYGIDSVPSLLYFEKGIPTVYEGRLEDEESVLKWLEQQTTSDEIEDITDEMLDLILEKMPYVAVLFCKLICTFTLSSPPQPILTRFYLILFCVLCSAVESPTFFLFPVWFEHEMIEITKQNQQKKQQLIEWSKSNQLIYPILLSSIPLFSTRMFNTFSFSYPCSSILCVACANHLIIDLPPEYVLCSKIQFKTSFSIDIFRWILGLRVSYVFNCFSICCISVAFSTFISNRNFYLGLLFLQPMKKKNKNKKYLSE